MKSISSVISICVILSFLGCKKDEVKKVSTEIWDCHYKQTWDSTSTRNALLGTWQWQYSYTFEGSSDLNKNAHKGLEIEFQSNGLLNVFQDNQLIQTSKWKLKDGDIDLYEIETDPYVAIISGRILICHDQIEFNSSYLDGPDNFFKRK